MAALTIIFEKLHIHNDSDNFGAGSFTFSLRVNNEEVVALKRQQEKSTGQFFDLTKGGKNSKSIALSGGEKLIISAHITEHDDDLTGGDDRASARETFDPRAFPLVSTTAKRLHIHGDGIHAELFYAVETNISFPKDFVLYEHINFEGNFQILKIPPFSMNHVVDVEQLNIGNDAVSSVEIPFGQLRSKMVLFEHARAQGAFLELDKSHTNLTEKFFWTTEGIKAQKNSWNDATSSVRIMWVPKEIAVYTDRCYGGKMRELPIRIAGDSVSTYRSNDLQSFDNAISSVTIPADYILVLYAEDDTKGDALIITKDIPELRNSIVANANGTTMGWHDHASSLRVIKSKGRVVLFNQNNYGGDYFEQGLPPANKSIVINLGDTAVGDNKLKSIITAGAEITLYELKNKGGRAIRLDDTMQLSDIASISKDFAWDQKTSSVEIKTL